MRQSLGAPASSFEICQVHPFDDDQVQAFLRLKGLSGDIPEWIPTRPLLLTYLVTKGLLEVAIRAESAGEYPRGSAWLSLIVMIAERAPEQSVAVDNTSLIEFMDESKALSDPRQTTLAVIVSFNTLSGWRRYSSGITEAINVGVTLAPFFGD